MGWRTAQLPSFPRAGLRAFPAPQGAKVLEPGKLHAPPTPHNAPTDTQVEPAARRTPTRTLSSFHPEWMRQDPYPGVPLTGKEVV